MTINRRWALVLYAAILALAIWGCATPTYSRPDGNYTSFDRDVAECNNQQAMAHPGGFGTAYVFHNCMVAKGYRKE